MSDIVDRLEAAVVLLARHVTPFDADEIMTDASAEIKRLREMLKTRDAEIKRLREALEYIAESHDAGRHDGKPEECPAHDDVFMWLMAREALAEGEGDD